MKKTIFIILVITAMINKGQTGLLASYPFNGNANDTSGNGHNGTVVNAVLTADRFGNANNAYYFNGTNAYIDLGQGFTYSSHSVVGWFNCYNYPTPVSFKGAIISKLHLNDFPFKNNELAIRNTKDLETATGSGITWDGVATSDSMNLNTWTFFAYSYNATDNEIKIYINAVCTDSSTISGYSDVDTAEIFIGARPQINNSTDFFFDGAIDDINIYDIVVSQAQVDSLFYLGNPTSSIKEPEQKVKIIKTEYYNSLGQKLSEQSNGLNIEIIFFNDGKKQVKKIFRQE